MTIVMIIAGKAHLVLRLTLDVLWSAKVYPACKIAAVVVKVAAAGNAPEAIAALLLPILRV